MASVDEAKDSRARRPLRVFFIPFFATGHMIPLVDIARLFAARGVDSTILVTPANATLIQPTIDRAASAGFPIRTLVYPFPSAESGLPPGVENISHLPPAESHRIDAASPHTASAHEQVLCQHRPDAVVSDTHFHWTTTIARDIGVPRVTFHAIGLFPACVMNSLFNNVPHLSVSDDATPFIVPALPHTVRMLRPELPDFLRGETHITAAMDSISEAESGSLGVVVNSFAEIEGDYAEYNYRVCRMRSFFMGPVALASCRVGEDPSAGENGEWCLRWLDGKEAGSVVYVAFGSWSKFSGEQMREMAVGLEAAGHPFIWVVRDDGEVEWMPKGFEKRMEGRGVVVRDWAPQVAVLGHGAVGAFVTHCGWNSVLEGVSAGLPMVTWPLSTEQFINEKLVVEVLRVGMRAWEGPRSTAEAEKVVVAGEEFGRAVGRVMGGGAEADDMRWRAREYGEKARAAVKEGGSSYEGLGQLIDEIRAWPGKHANANANANANVEAV